MDKLVEIIAKLSLEIGRMEESAKEQFNFNELTLTQMNYLETINNLHNPNLTELTAEMNLTKPTVKVAIDKLIEKDFIYRVKSDDDRRSAHLHLTVKGKGNQSYARFCSQANGRVDCRKIGSNRSQTDGNVV